MNILRFHKTSIKDFILSISIKKYTTKQHTMLKFLILSRNCSSLTAEQSLPLEKTLPIDISISYEYIIRTPVNHLH